MKRRMLVGLLSGVLALAPFGAALVAAPQQGEQSKPQSMAGAGQMEPKMQPETDAADISELPSGEVDLGSIRIPRAVTADGKPLAAGTYRVRLTAETADASASPGATAEYERWVEFLKGDEVVGREMASVVPDSEIDTIAQSGRPAAGGSKVELLRGGDFLRVWIRRQSANVLVHLPTGAPGT